jgi:hypothetical protein
VSARAPGGCDRFDDRELLRQERGEPDSDDSSDSYDSHLATCPTCQQRLARTEALRRALGQLPVQASTTNWEQSVWARIDQGRGQRRRRRLWLGLPVVLAAAGVLLLVRSPARPPGEGGVPVLALAFEAGPERMRSNGAAVGATVVLDGAALQMAHAELRIYRDDAGLLLRCTTEPPCQRRDGRLAARFTIPAIGRYRVLLLQAPVPLPPPAGGYDQDLAAVTAAQSTVHVEQSFEVW